MSDDLNKKIKQITDMLSQENLPDNLKGLLSMLGGQGNSSSESTSQTDKPLKNTEEENESSELADNIEMARKVAGIIERLKSHNDPRINLLTALRPFMGNRRQKRINNCINILRMSSLTRVIEEHDKGLL
jgi:hypothetical protein